MCVSISLKCIPLLSVPFSSGLLCKRLDMILPDGHLQALSHGRCFWLTTGHVRLSHNYFIISITFERGLHIRKLGTQSHKDVGKYDSQQGSSTALGDMD